MADLQDLIARVENGEGADRGLMHEAWNALAQIDPRFRRFACSIIDDTGTTQAGSFAALVDAGAFIDAVMGLKSDMRASLSEMATMEGMAWFASAHRETPFTEGYSRNATPARALLAAILRAKEASEPKRHASDCAVHNEPESPNGPCDCDGEPPLLDADRSHGAMTRDVEAFLRAKEAGQ